MRRHGRVRYLGRGLFPNNTGGQILSNAIDDPNVRLLCFQIYNDAMAEFQAESGNRLIPMAVLPTWDIDASVKEAERIAELGLRGITMTAQLRIVLVIQQLARRFLVTRTRKLDRQQVLVEVLCII